MPADDQTPSAPAESPEAEPVDPVAPVEPETPALPEAPAVPEAPALPLPRDQENCPNLGLSAIGDATDDPDAIAASPRFRAMAAAELDRAELVCAQRIERWRDDLLIQKLRADNQDDGVLVGGLGPDDPVLKLSLIEWASFQFRGGGPSDHNFAGVPTERMQVGDVEIIRTTRGGLVMERADSWGNVVVNGGWDLWMAHGGPSGEFGLPAGKPTGALGIGAYQDFARGTIVLPGVSTDLEAEAQPASRYRWSAITSEDLTANHAPAGSVIEVTGTSYYVDGDRVRHWIRTQGDWMCATSQLGAASTRVRGWAAAQLPLGEQFVCPR